MKQPFRRKNRRRIQQIFTSRTGVAFRPRPFARTRRLGILAAALCIALCVPPLMAAYVPAAHDLLYQFSPATAQFFKPVRRACEDNGIRMEVLSAYIHGDTAEVYVSLEDLTGDRIDGTADLFDSYTLYTPHGTPSNVAGTAPQVAYDASARQAVFYIRLTQEGVDFSGDKITFTAHKILSHKQKFEGPLALDPAQASVRPATQHIQNIRGSGGPQALYFDDGCTVLSPQPPQELTRGVAFTAMGFVGGKLRIQLHYGDILNTDNHGFVTLQNSAGEQIDCVTNVAFWDEDGTGSYEEYWFDVGPDQVQGLSAQGSFWTCGTAIQGHWEITFPLERAASEAAPQ